MTALAHTFLGVNPTVTHTSGEKKDSTVSNSTWSAAIGDPPPPSSIQSCSYVPGYLKIGYRQADGKQQQTFAVFLHTADATQAVVPCGAKLSYLELLIPPRRYAV